MGLGKSNAEKGSRAEPLKPQTNRPGRLISVSPEKLDLEKRYSDLVQKSFDRDNINPDLTVFERQTGKKVDKYRADVVVRALGWKTHDEQLVPIDFSMAGRAPLMRDRIFRDKVLQKGYEMVGKGVEWSYVLDGDAMQLEYHTDNKQYQIELTDRAYNALVRDSEGAVTMHNHPKGPIYQKDKETQKMKMYPAILSPSTVDFAIPLVHGLTRGEYIVQDNGKDTYMFNIRAIGRAFTREEFKSLKTDLDNSIKGIGNITERFPHIMDWKVDNFARMEATARIMGAIYIGKYREVLDTWNAKAKRENLPQVELRVSRLEKAE